MFCNGIVLSSLFLISSSSHNYLHLDQETVTRLASLPQLCYNVEYPNELNHVLNNKSDIMPPSGQCSDDRRNGSWAGEMCSVFQSSTPFSTVVSTGTALFTATG